MTTASEPPLEPTRPDVSAASAPAPAPTTPAPSVAASPEPAAAPAELDGLWKILGIVDVPAAITTPDTRIVWCTGAFSDLASQQPEALIGRRVAEALGTDRADRVTSVLIDVATSSRTLGGAKIAATDWSGTERQLAISASRTDVWTSPGHLLVIAENRSHDRRGGAGNGTGVDTLAVGALAALPSRSTFENLFDASLRRAQRTGEPIALMICNLDGFSEVNDRLSREAGDTLIAATAARLSHALRGEDLLMHDHGDQFIVAADAVANEQVAQQVARRLRIAVGEPIVIENTEVRVGMTIGFSLAYGNERLHDLVEQSERALAHARSIGRNQTSSIDDATAASAPIDAAQIDWNELSGTDRG